MKQFDHSNRFLNSVRQLFFLLPVLSLLLLAAPVYASCEGCLCSGDPCRLCPLPAVEGETPKADEPEICARIRDRVPPISAKPGENEYFPSLDQSISVCVNEGGDVIRNRRRSEEFSSRFYCKPPTTIPRR